MSLFAEVDEVEAVRESNESESCCWALFEDMAVCRIRFIVVQTGAPTENIAALSRQSLE